MHENGGGRNQKTCPDFSTVFFSKLTYSEHTDQLLMLKCVDQVFGGPQVSR